jgi:hypothetical protein
MDNIPGVLGRGGLRRRLLPWHRPGGAAGLPSRELGLLDQPTRQSTSVVRTSPEYEDLKKAVAGYLEYYIPAR